MADEEKKCPICRGTDIVVTVNDDDALKCLECGEIFRAAPPAAAPPADVVSDDEVHNPFELAHRDGKLGIVSAASGSFLILEGRTPVAEEVQSVFDDVKWRIHTANEMLASTRAALASEKERIARVEHGISRRMCDVLGIGYTVRVDHWAFAVEDLKANLAKAEAERDAAVTELTGFRKAHTGALDKFNACSDAQESELASLRAELAGAQRKEGNDAHK